MRWLALTAALFATACATPRAAPVGPPSTAEAPGQIAPAQARFYVDCLAQAAANGTFDREANLIRFHCSGAPAHAFYDGLAAYSAQIGSEIAEARRTLRFTQKIQHDTYGVDYCWSGADNTFGCTLAFNAGEFLNSP